MGIAGVNREFALRCFHTFRVEDFFCFFVDDLHDGVLEVDLVFKMSGCFTTIVVVEIKGEGPAGELGILILGDVGESLVALKGDLAGFLIEAGEAVAVGALLLVAAVGGVRVGQHGDFIAKPVEVIPGPGKG